ncbi:Inorganic pyrophosphatase [seawater metagenome]|uniref:inorganic diphosphatase n=1 Tax=seawater metagenome TaxID=1561972 RepID=A0A5E8CGP2_9ZZZZ
MKLELIKRDYDILNNSKIIYFYYITPLLQKQLISPWHDIPLYTNYKDVYNFVVEMPSLTLEKYEIQTKVMLNPIMQDKLNNILRVKPRLESHRPFLYGAFPQTYEDLDWKDKRTGFRGDNDPLDGIILFQNKEYENIEIGSILQVEILGSIPLIDEGEIDWKVIGYPKGDKFYSNNSLNTLLKDTDQLSNLIKIIDWFLEVKYIEKEIINHLHLNPQFIINNKNDIRLIGEKYFICNKKLTLEIINDTNYHWKQSFSKVK